MAQLSSANEDLDLEAGQIDPYGENSTEALQDIAFKCGTKVEFKQALVSSTELQFSVKERELVKELVEQEGKHSGTLLKDLFYIWLKLTAINPVLEFGIWFNLDTWVCTSLGTTSFWKRKNLKIFVDKYLSQLRPDSSNMPEDGSRVGKLKDNGFIGDVNSVGYQSVPRAQTAMAPSRIMDPSAEASKRSMSSISALKELCNMEGLGVAFQTRPQFSSNRGQKTEVYAEVEIDGQVLGKGIGLTWDEAKSQAAEKALGALKSMLGQFPYKRPGSPR
ncbi:UNVERIFIED_CONTAM: RNA polymerase II C-terminal domain phosphatase-like 1 [Sesamum radiatum]|uniref:RNA polymerase II C-terminal domain phosphatase-like 1 n=1 Tax=Sesamum radiatum TaxID=300843 RepID=A0AAW2K468_SESRA